MVAKSIAKNLLFIHNPTDYQRALHFLPSLADLFIPTPTRLLREAF